MGRPRTVGRPCGTRQWSPVFRYFGPPLSSSPSSGRRRPTKPSTSPWCSMGKITRSRNRSIRRPVRARVATPAASISSSLTPCPRRWSTRFVQPAGASPAWRCGWLARSSPNRSARYSWPHDPARWDWKNRCERVLTSIRRSRVTGRVVPFLGALVGGPQLGLGRLQLDGAAGAAQSRQQQVARRRWPGRTGPVRCPARPL